MSAWFSLNALWLILPTVLPQLQQIGGNLSVGASVIDYCTIAAGPLDFGGYDPVAANSTAALVSTATITVNCTRGAATTIDLGQGNSAAPGSTDAAPRRRLAYNNNFLRYDLYTDPSLTRIWGARASGALYSGTGRADSLTVYGAILGGQNVPEGSYSDVVRATVNF